MKALALVALTLVACGPPRDLIEEARARREASEAQALADQVQEAISDGDDIEESGGLELPRFVVDTATLSDSDQQEVLAAFGWLDARLGVGLPEFELAECQGDRRFNCISRAPRGEIVDANGDPRDMIAHREGQAILAGDHVPEGSLFRLGIRHELLHVVTPDEPGFDGLGHVETPTLLNWSVRNMTCRDLGEIEAAMVCAHFECGAIELGCPLR